MITLHKPLNDLQTVYTFETTIFPDKTSQVWKINPEPNKNDLFIVEWKFENEAEVFHLIQLGMLLQKLTGVSPILKTTTLPYARQDKDITNTSTFALEALMGCLFRHYHKVLTVDVHSSRFSTEFGRSFGVENTIPNERIRNVLKLTDSDLVCYPDKGAAQRGYSYDDEYYGAPIILDKDRNQETGEIKGLKFLTKFKPDLTGYKILIIDDLCDRGGTFIGAAKLLKEQGAEKVFLYTTHGLYTGGLKFIFDGGIDRIFNYTKEEANPNEVENVRETKTSRKKILVKSQNIQ